MILLAEVSLKQDSTAVFPSRNHVLFTQALLSAR